MASNHQKTLTRLETSTMVLATWLTNKSHQSRRIVQNSYQVEILRVVWTLWQAVCDVLDGVDEVKKVHRCLNIIRRGAFLIGGVERDNRPKKVNGKPKKHYGFDAYAVAYIDELCDDIAQQVGAYGQIHKPCNRGQGGRSVQRNEGPATCGSSASYIEGAGNTSVSPPITPGM